MITDQQIKTINYLVISINEFAERHALNADSAYCYLAQFGGIAFLMQHYEIEHTLSLDDTVDDLETICRQNGGLLQ